MYCGCNCYTGVSTMPVLQGYEYDVCCMQDHVYCGCNCYTGVSMMSVVCRIMCIVGVTATRL